MTYLLINHVPFGAGSSSDTFQVGDLFLQDLRAQARALKNVGINLVVATPCVQKLNAMSGGSFNTVEISPLACDFAYVPLPRYQSLKEYFKVRRDLNQKLHAAISGADIIQMDYGGHPFMLGQLAWPIATQLNKKRLWLFDGADPFPRLELDASKETNPLKRFLKRRSVQNKIAFCRHAIQTADLVFAHNAAVALRFKSVWNDRCHQFDRSFVTDEILVPDFLDRKNRLLNQNAPLNLLCAGRQIKIKGTDQVIRTVALLKQQNIPVTLNIMGDGDDLESFKQLTRELQLTDIIHFPGTVPYGPELFAEWDKADIMLVTNLTAEISRNVLLSLARGLPLLTYENPGTDTLLKENAAATLVPKGNVESLAGAIATLNKDRTKLIQLAENGLNLAKVKTLEATHQRRAELAKNLIAAP
ncbi:MAG TPA: glycosyltransferase [Tepidisphaeraceae bacterium]|jgi:glycosyltransferase involved in cell wall biosynthesis|nr:glycosyltransferase [Tepidisphaeraceae bacterium]